MLGFFKKELIVTATVHIIDSNDPSRARLTIDILLPSNGAQIVVNIENFEIPIYDVLNQLHTLLENNNIGAAESKKIVNHLCEALKAVDGIYFKYMTEQQFNDLFTYVFHTQHPINAHTNPNLAQFQNKITTKTRDGLYEFCDKIVQMTNLHLKAKKEQESIDTIDNSKFN